MVSDSTIVQPTLNRQTIDVAEMKLPMTSLETLDVIQSHDMPQQLLRESQQHEMPHLEAGIAEESDVGHDTTEPERRQDINGQSTAVEDTISGEHPPLASSPHIESKTQANVDVTDVMLQQIQLDEDMVSDEGFEVDAEDEIKTALFYNSLQNDNLPNRIEKARKRLLQHVAYTALMEDRMLNMEKRLKELEDKAGDQDDKAGDQDNKAGNQDNKAGDQGNSSAREPDSKGTNKGEREYVAIPGISRMSFDEYKPKPQDLEISKALIRGEQLIGEKVMAQLPQRRLIEVVMSGLGAGNDFPRDTTDKAEAAHIDAPNGGSNLDETHHAIPERIRINSLLLLESLQDVTGQEFNLTRRGFEGPKKSLAMLRPFKFLATYEQDIRQYTHKLEERLTTLQAIRSTKTSTGQGSNVPCESADTGEPAKASADSTSGLDVDCTEEKNEIAVNDAMTGASMQHQEDMKEEGEKEDEEDYEKSVKRLEELQCLVNLLDHDLRPVFDLRRSIQVGSVSEIAFADLWHLFRIGDEICSSEGHPQAYRIIAVVGGRPSLCTKEQARGTGLADMDEDIDESATLKINSFCYGFDGKQLGPVQRIFEIKRYDGIKPITSLPVYPVKFSGVENGDITREGFIHRGQKFIELTQNRTAVVHKRYHGLTVNLEQLREEVDSEVIIDTSMALLKNPSLETHFGVKMTLRPNRLECLEFLDPKCHLEGCCENTAIHVDYGIDEKAADMVLGTTKAHRDILESSNLMTPEDLLICPCMVYGYVLRSRKWVSLDVRLVQDIPSQELGLDQLVLPEGHSETLLALVETHSKSAKLATGQKTVERQMDLVRGKGKGLIILLHGEPGVGKTSTAECVAEYTHRPLFQVTCGDIGDSAEVVEKTLENHFQLAHKWGCVLLLDEADVFLMARSKSDLKRNAIVSVFLRVLEYYSGILFLTTNRVGTFDPAFRSRIHMSFFYPKLGLKATLEIWKMNLKRMGRFYENMEVTPKERQKILAFAEEHFKECEALKTTWNGRQIRNAFQTAIALAEYEIHKAQERFEFAKDPKPRLEVGQFMKVADASRHFDEYIKATLGSAEEDLARERFERRDDLGMSDIDQEGGSKKKRTTKIYPSDNRRRGEDLEIDYQAYH